MMNYNVFRMKQSWTNRAWSQSNCQCSGWDYSLPVLHNTPTWFV